MNLDDLVGSQETVADALLEGVGVNRLAEVMDVGDVFGFLGRCGEADLCRRREVIQDFPPCRILCRTAAMALVDDDEVEECGREFPEDLLAFFRPGDRLIEPEVNLVSGVDAALAVDGGGQLLRRTVLAFDGLGFRRELGHRRAKWPEVVDHGLVDQHVAVGQKQDALLAARLPKPPDDLERGVGLAGACRHDQQYAVAALGDGLDGCVDGVDLVVAWGLATAAVEIVLEDDGFGLVCQPLPGAIARPQVTGRWEGIKTEGGFLLGRGARPVVEYEAVAVRREHEGDVQGLGILQPLLHAVAPGVGVVLGLDQRDGDVGLIVEDVVGALALAPADQLAAHDDATLGEADLLTDLRHLVPPGLVQGGRDELGADVALGEAFLFHCDQRSLVAFRLMPVPYSRAVFRARPSLAATPRSRTRPTDRPSSATSRRRTWSGRKWRAVRRPPRLHPGRQAADGATTYQLHGERAVPLFLAELQFRRLVDHDRRSGEAPTVCTRS